MTEITAIEIHTVDEPEVFDFNSPEDVLIQVTAEEDADWTLPHWKKHTIETCTIIRGKEGITGAASYEQSYGSFLDYTIQDMIDCPGEGWFVIVGVTAVYHKGDGWMTDDDMDFDYTDVRPATAEEIALG
jgi:hypothetical protein